MHQIINASWSFSCNFFLPDSYFSSWWGLGLCVCVCVLCLKCCGKGDVVLCGIWIPEIPVWERVVDQGRWGKERNTSVLEGRKAWTSNCASLCLLCDKDTELVVFSCVYKWRMVTFSCVWLCLFFFWEHTKYLAVHVCVTDLCLVLLALFP